MGDRVLAGWTPKVIEGEGDPSTGNPWEDVLDGFERALERVPFSDPDRAALEKGRNLARRLSRSRELLAGSAPARR